MAAPSAVDEISKIDPPDRIIELSTGYQVKLVRLRTRQFFRLLKVLTHGAGAQMLRQGLDFGVTAEDFGQRLMTLILLSIPDAEQETIEFVQSMVHPPPGALSPKKPNELTRADREANDLAWARHADETYNPSLDDLVTIVEAIVQQEAPEIQSLGKRLSEMISQFQKTGQDQTAPEPPPTPQKLAETEATPPPSISSVPSTAGPTSTSSTSPSADSAKSQPPSVPAVSASSGATPG